MQVRWTEQAYEDLVGVIEHIAKDSIPAAQRMASTIYEEAASLANLPHRGRLASEPGTREIVLPKTGHIITYEVQLDAVFILRIHHGSQDWPLRSN